MAASTGHVKAAAYTAQVAATTAWDSESHVFPTGVTKRAARAIRLHSAGTLVYTPPGLSSALTLTDMPAGLEILEVASIGAGTTTKVTLYF